MHFKLLVNFVIHKLKAICINSLQTLQLLNLRTAWGCNVAPNILPAWVKDGENTKAKVLP